MRLEYKIYYEQSETGPSPEVEQEIMKGSTRVADLENGKKTTVKTRAVELYKEEQSESGNIINSDILIGGKGEVHGMRARLYVTLPDGKEVYREFSEPSSLSNDRFPWVQSE